jgi:hypothetical protein
VPVLPPIGRKGGQVCNEFNRRPGAAELRVPEGTQVRWATVGASPHGHRVTPSGIRRRPAPARWRAGLLVCRICPTCHAISSSSLSLRYGVAVKPGQRRAGSAGRCPRRLRPGRGVFRRRRPSTPARTKSGSELQRRGHSLSCASKPPDDDGRAWPRSARACCGAKHIRVELDLTPSGVIKLVT